MASWSAGVQAQAVGSALPELPLAGPTVEQASAAPPVSGKLVPRLAEPATARDDSPPVFVSGERMTGYDQRRLELMGNAEIRRGGGVVKGDRLTYEQDSDEAFAQGNSRLSRGGLLAVGPEARLRVEANEGYMLSPDYYFQPSGGSGKGERIDFVDKDRSAIKRATYTTCSPDNADWYFSARRLDIDSDRQVGTAYGGVLRFFDVPVMAAPVFTFPLSDARRSGFLTPLLGYRSGLDLTVPYYFNIAPNRDLTLFPRYLNARGLQLGSDFRYLGEGYAGRIRGEFLPDDRKTRTDRWSYSVQHTQHLATGLNAYVNVSEVSDARYPDDLSYAMASSVQRQYTKEAGITYNWRDLAVLARVQKFQTLAPSQPSYERVPQLNARYVRYDLGGFDAQVEADYTRFRIPLTTAGVQQPLGERVFVQPSLSYPIVRPGWFVTPKAMFNATQYRMEPASNTAGAANTLSRALPTVSLDSGMAFERDAPAISRLFGRGFMQTVEPRLFYAYTPFRDQSQFPLFDTVQSDFGYGQIFSETPFTGYDRIADNNKLTAGVTTRLIETDSGIERFRGTLAQRFDFTGQRVQLNGTAPEARSGYSDLLAATTVQLFKGYYIDAGMQYSPGTERIVYSNIAFSWRPEERKLLNAGYRYRRPTSVTDNAAIDQFEVSGQWPITQRAYGVGRVAFDLGANQLVDALAGIEYVADCWVGRFVYRRFRNTSQGYTGLPYLELEFRGLSRIGSNPLEILRLNVPGYTPVLASPVPPSRFDHYE